MSAPNNSSNTNYASGAVAYHTGPTVFPGASPGTTSQPPTKSLTMGSSGQATVLPYAFTTGTLHDPTFDAWNFDTANGSTQLEGVDIDETFSPVVKPGPSRTVLSLAASRHWSIHQFDVKNAFLHGDIFETVYMHQPPRFRDSVYPDYVCLLQWSLYGLKHAPQAWFQRQGADTAYLLLYVDDIVLTASSKILLQHVIRSLHQEFSMTDLGRTWLIVILVALLLILSLN
ncbi:ribonuclease H-like domain-containing protein [Tanacetum coccineum]